MKNRRIRMAMVRAGVNQRELAELLGMTVPAVSIMLQHELAVKEQDLIVATIRKSVKEKED